MLRQTKEERFAKKKVARTEYEDSDGCMNLFSEVRS